MHMILQKECGLYSVSIYFAVGDLQSTLYVLLQYDFITRTAICWVDVEEGVNRQDLYILRRGTCQFAERLQPRVSVTIAGVIQSIIPSEPVLALLSVCNNSKMTILYKGLVLALLAAACLEIARH